VNDPSGTPPGPANVLPDDAVVVPAAQVAQREAVQRWRLVYAREAIDADAAQREQIAAWESAFANSGLPIAGLDAARPKPRFASAAPLAAAILGEAELMDVWLVERLPAWRVRAALAGVLPAGNRLVDLFDVWLGEPALPGRVIASVYRGTLPEGVAEPGRLVIAAARMMEAAAIPRERLKKDSVVTYDLRPFLVALEVQPAASGVTATTLRMTLRHDPEKGVGRPEEVLAALGDELGTRIHGARLVRESLVLAEPPPAAPPPARRRIGPRPVGPRAA
jgi:radical SAM-linked protein